MARPLPIDESDFAHLKALMQRRAACTLSESTAHIWNWRLEQVAWRRNLQDVKELCGRLRSGEDPGLEEEVVEQLLDTDTWFFRDEGVFMGIHRVVLPDLLKSRAGAAFLKFWAPGAGSGQDVYSLILLVRHHFPAMNAWDLRVVGTDILESALERARLGSYTDAEVRRGLPLALLARYFTQLEKRWVLHEHVRKQALFKLSNLVEGFGPETPTFDVVCLRNLMAGFEPAQRGRAMESASRQVSPGGFLVLGAAETKLGVEPDPRVFRKLGEGIFKSFAQQW